MQKPSLVLSYTTEDPGPQMAAAVAEILSEQGFNVTLDDGFESAEELLAELESGNVDLGLLEEPLSPNPQLRMLMPLYPSVLHAVHNKSLNSPDLPALLAADPLYAGPHNSLGYRLAIKLAQHYGVPGIESRLRDTPWVPAPDLPPQAYLIFGGLLTSDARVGFANYQLFSFDNTSSNSAEALALLYPNLRTFTLPGGIYPDLTDQTVETLAVETLLVGRPTLDSEVAYAAVSALRAQPQKLEQAYPLSRATFANAIDHSIHTLALHEGAQRYINKDEPGFIERYAEVLALCATLLLALGTMATTLLRSRRQRRKDRLDGYFLRLQDLRSELHSETGQTPGAISAAVSSLEGEVLELLVEERLAVDSALVTFFLLSESVRREIDTPN